MEIPRSEDPPGEIPPRNNQLDENFFRSLIFRKTLSLT